MIYLELFIGFFCASCFAFGGAYAAIPIIRDMVVSYGWLTDEALSYMIAVSESTPGPIMVNLATYVGSHQGGILGSLVSTFAVVLPSFLIIIIIMTVLRNVLENRYVQAVLDGLKPCVIGIILSTGLTMTIGTLFPTLSPMAVDWRAIIIGAILIVAMYMTKRIKGKPLSPIGLILVSAVLGMIVYGI